MVDEFSVGIEQKCGWNLLYIIQFSDWIRPTFEIRDLPPCNFIFCDGGFPLAKIIV
jgi:hypothetical protein